MLDHTTALYCMVDDLLKAVGHKDDCRRELLPKQIHAVSLDGSLLKASLFVIAFALDKAFI